MIASQLNIEKTIIHEITPRMYAPPKEPELILSNALSPLDEDLRTYFKERIVDSLRLAAFPVKAREERTSPTPELVHLHLTDPKSNFVDLSQEIAKHLFAAQQKVRSSPGLLVVIAGSVSSGRAMVLLKLQKQQGLNLERTGPKGAETYNLDHLRRLMLTDETRVYKIALFEADGVVQPDDLRGEVSDKQRYSSPEKRMAAFFLNDFLGCEVQDDPTQMTNSYYVSGEKFLNERVTTPEKQARYHRAFIADLASQADKVAPKKFADEHLDKGDREAFLNTLKADDVPTTQFSKDTELIQSRLEEEEYVFNGGIRVRGSQEALAEHSEISEGDGKVLEMLITDRLKSVSGASKRRR
jgi:37-kD nucleoid-associated bacterial protein